MKIMNVNISIHVMDIIYPATARDQLMEDNIRYGDTCSRRPVCWWASHWLYIVSVESPEKWCNSGIKELTYMIPVRHDDKIVVVMILNIDTTHENRFYIIL